MRELRVKTNQIELQVREYEHPGDAVIFLHFSGVNLMMWQPLVPYFKDHYRLVLVDLRGHGKSDKPESGYHIDELARDILGVMQQLKIERAHIVGSSLGAEAGLSLAAKHPEKVLSLVCDGALSSEYGPYGTWEGSEIEFQTHVAKQLKKMSAAPKKVYPSIDALVDAKREIFEKYGWWNAHVETVERYGAYQLEGQYASGMEKSALADYMKYYFQYRFEEYYKKVTCPILMLREEEIEDEREKAAMQGLCQLAEHAQIVEVSGWVHPYGWLIDPKNVSEALLKFLAEIATDKPKH